jgi:ADP-heptose:LPS heptosyltransferase
MTFSSNSPDPHSLESHSSGNNSVARVLVVRNDKLGDFMLAWPALATLKAAAPTPHITALVPSYTAPMAEACPWIDEVILDPGDEAPGSEQRQLLKTLREKAFDAQLTLFSTPRIGWLGWRARIPLRLAPATKWAQIFYNRRITQRRSQSAKPEYVYNRELAEALIKALDLTPGHATPPFWPEGSASRAQERQALAETLPLSEDRPWVFLHAGSGGSAVNLSLNAYAYLASEVDRQLAAGHHARPHWILTAGPGEEDNADALTEALAAHGLSAHRQPPQAGLAGFSRSLAAADAFIAGSTGPLHVAGCLNVITIGFYPARRSATPLRWQTCNDDDRRLAFHPPESAVETDMTAIDLDIAATAIAHRLAALEAAPSTDIIRESP